MATKWQELVTALLLCSNLGVILALAAPRELKEEEVLTLDPSTLSLVHRANERLLSLTLDSGNVKYRWVDKNLSNEKFLKLVSLLAPAYFRIGGNYCDTMLFKETFSLEQKQDGEDASRAGSTFYLTGDEWKLINDFAIKAGLKLVFCINALQRNGSSWDPSNTKELLEYSNKLGYNDVAFQLGNEPDRFTVAHNTYVSPSQLAADFATFRSLLDSFPRYKSSLLIGPDLSSTESFLWEFLMAQNNTLSAVGTHQYDMAGSTARIDTFLNPGVLNKLVLDVNSKKAILANTSTKAPLWLTETSSAYNGGATNLTDRFIDGFSWLDKLGVAAKLGVEVVCRQEIFGALYGLLGSDFDPNPDWWLSIMHKKLVGTGVLNTPLPAISMRVRLYAQCSKTSPGAVLIFGMNMNSEDVDVQVNGSAAGVGKGKVSAYILTGETGLQSQTVLLNGKRLELGADYSLPKLEPVSVAASPLHLPAFSLAFFVLEDVQVAACKEN